MRFTAAITHESPWWVARCLEDDHQPRRDPRAGRATLALNLEDEPGRLSVGEAPIIAPVDVDVDLGG